MTVGELRAALEDFADHLPVLIDDGVHERGVTDFEVDGGQDYDGMAACIIRVVFP